VSGREKTWTEKEWKTIIQKEGIKAAALRGKD